MNAKNHLLVLLGLILATPIFTACDPEDDNVDKPSITLTEVGLNNSKTTTIGSELHVEADIVALGRISTVRIEIHAETMDSGELDTTYTEFEGLKSTSFHKHIDIPATFEPGDYHLHFSVTDQLGQQSTVETEIALQL